MPSCIVSASFNLKDVKLLTWLQYFFLICPLGMIYCIMSENLVKIIFRQTPENRFTIPFLLNVLEKDNIDKNFSIQVVSSIDQLIKECKSAKPAIVAYSFMTPQMPEIWKEVQEIKKQLPKQAFLMAGGPHPSGSPEQTLQMGFDMVIAGSAESVLTEAIQKIIEKPNDTRNQVIDGGSVKQLDDFLPVSRTIPFIPPLEIMRGCYYRCGFCQTGQSQKPVYRSLDSVQFYLNKLIHRDLLFRTGFICPSGLEYHAARPGKPNLEKIESLLDMAKTIGIRYLEYGIFPSEIHPKTLSSEALRLIRKYCSNQKITLGAQSGSNEILKKLKRGHTTEDIEFAADMICSQGFRPILDFIIGFPEETENDRQITLNWIRHLHTRYRARIQMHYFLPLAGTRFTDHKPTLPGLKSRALLDAFYQGGICTNWWRTGFKKSWALIRAREALERTDSPSHYSFCD